MTLGIMYDVLKEGEPVLIEVFAEYDPDLMIDSIETSDLDEAEEMVLSNERHYVYIRTIQ